MSGKIETTLEQMRESYDWPEVFKYADGFTLEDVAEVLASVEGENDSDDWLGVFRLKDGRVGVVRAGCDYTGWGCQESGSSEMYDGPEAALSPLGITRDERERLSL